MQGCSFEGCDRPICTKKSGLCRGHYSQRRRGQELKPLGPRGRPRNPPDAMRTYVDSVGYTRAIVGPAHPLYVYCDYGRSQNRKSRGSMLHRLVVADSLGRKLSPAETVHHIDGDKSNNTLGNLQLRHGRHGKGKKIVCADCGSHNTIAVELD